MKSILTIAAFLLFTASVFANTVQLSGFVIDKENNEELAGASISVDGKKYYSDLDGNFSIDNLTPGKCQIKVELISYQPVTLEIDVSKDESININLQQISVKPAVTAMETETGEDENIALLQK